VDTREGIANTFRQIADRGGYARGWRVSTHRRSIGLFTPKAPRFITWRCHRRPDVSMTFQREAKTLASLNHPNIAGIYGLEESEA
jgi:serine/threonine protein kinase